MILTVVDHDKTVHRFTGLKQDVVWLSLVITSRLSVLSMKIIDDDGTQVFPTLKIDYVLTPTEPTQPIFMSPEAKTLYHQREEKLLK